MSEKSLLNAFLGKLGAIDPDVICGHNIYGAIRSWILFFWWVKTLLFCRFLWRALWGGNGCGDFKMLVELLKSSVVRFALLCVAWAGAGETSTGQLAKYGCGQSIASKVQKHSSHWIFTRWILAVHFSMIIPLAWNILTILIPNRGCSAAV